MNFFFVCGAPKSGTTWLQRVLDAHPEVCCSGEGHFMERFSVPLAKVIRDYNEQVAVVARNVYEGKPYYEPVDQTSFDAVVRSFIIQRMVARSAGSQVRWIGDKTPRYTRHLTQLHRLFPNGKFVNIVRDPRDVAMSRLHHALRSKRNYLANLSAPESLQFLREGADDWVRSVQPVFEFETANPGCLINVRYETMIEQPAAEARKVFGFLGVSTADDVIAEVVRTTSFEAQSGRKPGTEDTRSFLRKGVAGDWVGRLEGPALDALVEACGDHIRRLGYV
jgi:hypothetical protein